MIEENSGPAKSVPLSEVLLYFNSGEVLLFSGLIWNEVY